MAITQTGSTQRFTWTFGAANAATLSSTITVPSDAQIAVVALSSFNGSATYFSTGSVTLTKSSADTAMTLATSGTSTSVWQGFLWYLVLPDTGTNKSLKYDWAGAGTASDDAVLTLRFYTGIDTASPVRDSDVLQLNGFPRTTPTLTAQTGDLIVACDNFFSNATNGTIDTWSNLTLSEQITNNTNADQAWAHGSPSGNTTVASSTGTNAAEGTLVAIVLQPAASGTAHVGEATFSGLGAFPVTGFGLSPLQPDADSIDGTWTDQAGGTSLFAAIDEMSVNDADYIKSAASPSNDICKISMGDPSVTPSQPFIVMYRYEKTGVEQIDLGVRLLQATTEIAAWSHSDISTSFVTAEQTLSGGQFSSISDFNNLFIEFTATSVSELILEGDFSGDLTLEGDFSGSLLLEGS